MLKILEATARNKLLRFSAQELAAQHAAALARLAGAEADGSEPVLPKVLPEMPADLKARYFPGRDVPCILVGDTYVPALERRQMRSVAQGAVAGAVRRQREPLPDWEHVYDLRREPGNTLGRARNGKKWNKLGKWLDPAQWIPQTDRSRLVLPNGMTLWSERRRSGAAQKARGGGKVFGPQLRAAAKSLLAKQASV